MFLEYPCIQTDPKFQFVAQIQIRFLFGNDDFKVFHIQKNGEMSGFPSQHVLGKSDDTINGVNMEVAWTVSSSTGGGWLNLPSDSSPYSDSVAQLYTLPILVNSTVVAVIGSISNYPNEHCQDQILETSFAKRVTIANSIALETLDDEAIDFPMAEATQNELNVWLAQMISVFKANMDNTNSPSLSITRLVKFHITLVNCHDPSMSYGDLPCSVAADNIQFVALILAPLVDNTETGEPISTETHRQIFIVNPDDDMVDWSKSVEDVSQEFNPILCDGFTCEDGKWCFVSSDTSYDKHYELSRNINSRIVYKEAIAIGRTYASIFTNSFDQEKFVSPFAYYNRFEDSFKAKILSDSIATAIYNNLANFYPNMNGASLYDDIIDSLINSGIRNWLRVEVINEQTSWAMIINCRHSNLISTEECIENDDPFAFVSLDTFKRQYFNADSNFGDEAYFTASDDYIPTTQDWYLNTVNNNIGHFVKSNSFLEYARPILNSSSSQLSIAGYLKVEVSEEDDIVEDLFAKPAVLSTLNSLQLESELLNNMVINDELFNIIIKTLFTSWENYRIPHSPYIAFATDSLMVALFNCQSSGRVRVRYPCAFASVESAIIVGIVAPAMFENSKKMNFFEVSMAGLVVGDWSSSLFVSNEDFDLETFDLLDVAVTDRKQGWFVRDSLIKDLNDDNVAIVEDSFMMPLFDENTQINGIVFSGEFIDQPKCGEVCYEWYNPYLLNYMINRVHNMNDDLESYTSTTIEDLAASFYSYLTITYYHYNGMILMIDNSTMITVIDCHAPSNMIGNFPCGDSIKSDHQYVAVVYSAKLEISENSYGGPLVYGFDENNEIDLSKPLSIILTDEDWSLTQYNAWSVTMIDGSITRGYEALFSGTNPVNWYVVPEILNNHRYGIGVMTDSVYPSDHFDDSLSRVIVNNMAEHISQVTFSEESIQNVVSATTSSLQETGLNWYGNIVNKDGDAVSFISCDLDNPKRQMPCFYFNAMYENYVLITHSADINSTNHQCYPLDNDNNLILFDKPVKCWSSFNFYDGQGIANGLTGTMFQYINSMLAPIKDPVSHSQVGVARSTIFFEHYLDKTFAKRITFAQERVLREFSFLDLILEEVLTPGNITSITEELVEEFIRNADTYSDYSWVSTAYHWFAVYNCYSTHLRLKFPCNKFSSNTQFISGVLVNGYFDENVNQARYVEVSKDGLVDLSQTEMSVMDPSSRVLTQEESWLYGQNNAGWFTPNTDTDEMIFVNPILTSFDSSNVDIISCASKMSSKQRLDEDCDKRSFAYRVLHPLRTLGMSLNMTPINELNNIVEEMVSLFMAYGDGIDSPFLFLATENVYLEMRNCHHESYINRLDSPCGLRQSLNQFMIITATNNATMFFGDDDIGVKKQYYNVDDDNYSVNWDNPIYVESSNFNITNNDWWCSSYRSNAQRNTRVWNMFDDGIIETNSQVMSLPLVIFEEEKSNGEPIWSEKGFAGVGRLFDSFKSCEECLVKSDVFETSHSLATSFHELDRNFTSKYEIMVEALESNDNINNIILASKISDVWEYDEVKLCEDNWCTSDTIIKCKIESKHKIYRTLEDEVIHDDGSYYFDDDEWFITGLNGGGSLNDNGLVTYSQPLYNLNDGSVYGVLATKGIINSCGINSNPGYLTFVDNVPLNVTETDSDQLFKVDILRIGGSNGKVCGNVTFECVDCMDDWKTDISGESSQSICWEDGMTKQYISISIPGDTWYHGDQMLKLALSTNECQLSKITILQINVIEDDEKILADVELIPVSDLLIPVNSNTVFMNMTRTAGNTEAKLSLNCVISDPTLAKCEFLTRQVHEWNNDRSKVNREIEMEVSLLTGTTASKMITATVGLVDTYQVNINTITQIIEFVLDRVAPQMTIENVFMLPTRSSKEIRDFNISANEQCNIFSVLAIGSCDIETTHSVVIGNLKKRNDVFNDSNIIIPVNITSFKDQIPESGVSEFCFMAFPQDIAGNIGDMTFNQWTYDISAADITFTTVPRVITHLRETMFEFSVSDESGCDVITSCVIYDTNGDEWWKNTTCISDTSYDFVELPLGNNSFIVEATDCVDNKSSETFTWEIVIANEGEISLETDLYHLVLVNGVSSVEVAIKRTEDSNVPGAVSIRCIPSIDGGMTISENVLCNLSTKRIEYDPLKNEYVKNIEVTVSTKDSSVIDFATLTIEAFDPYYVTIGDDATLVFTVDHALPTFSVINHSELQTRISIEEREFEFECSEDVTILYQVNNGDMKSKECLNDDTVVIIKIDTLVEEAGSTDEVRFFKFKVSSITDNAGNVALETYDNEWIVDRVSPLLTLTNEDHLLKRTYFQEFAFEFSVTDGVNGCSDVNVECSIVDDDTDKLVWENKNCLPNKIYSVHDSNTIPISSTNHLWIRAIDCVGNPSVKEFTWEVFQSVFGEVELTTEDSTKMTHGVFESELVIARNSDGNIPASVDVLCHSSDETVAVCSLDPSHFSWDPDNQTVDDLSHNLKMKVELGSGISSIEYVEFSVSLSNAVNVDIASSEPLLFEIDHTLPTLSIKNLSSFEPRISDTTRSFDLICSESGHIHHTLVAESCNESYIETMSSDDIKNHSNYVLDNYTQMDSDNSILTLPISVSSLNIETASKYCFIAIIEDSVGNFGTMVKNEWIHDDKGPIITFDRLPLSRTSSTTAKYSFSVTDGVEGCEVETKCWVSDDEGGSFGIENNCTPNHLYTLISPYGCNTIHIQSRDCINNTELNEFMWEVSVSAIDVLLKNKTTETFDVIDPVSTDLYVNELGETAVISFGLPQSPRLGEYVRITCEVVSGINEVKILSPNSITFTSANWNSNSLYITLEGIPDMNNSDIDASFEVKCSTISEGGVQPLYTSVPDVNLHGNNQNVIIPAIRDVEVQKLEVINVNETVITWQSSLTEGDFALTLSGGEILRFWADEENYEGMIFNHENDNTESAFEFDFDELSFTELERNSSMIMIQLDEIDENDMDDVKKLDKYIPFTFTNNDYSHENGVNSIGGTIKCPSHCPGGESPGVYITKACVAEGFVTGKACLDVNDPDHTLCAYGVGVNCQTCGSIYPLALCPGGLRTYGPEGTYQSSVYDKPTECIPTDACKGWDIGADQTICAIGYKGVGCGSCDGGFYRSDRGICESCPKKSFFETVMPMLYIGAVAASVFAIIFSLLLLASRRNKGSKITLKYCFQKAMQFAIWVTLSLQVLIQVGKSSKGNIPPFLESFYGSLNMFVLEPDFLPPSCMSEVPFLVESIAMVCALIWVLFSFIADKIIGYESHTQMPRSNGIRGLAHKIGRLSHLSLALAYPIYTNYALSMLNCREVNGKLLLVSNTDFQCFDGSFLLTNILAIVTVAICSITFPVWSYVRCRKILKQLREFLVKSFSQSTLSVAEIQSRSMELIKELYDSVTGSETITHQSVTLYRSQLYSYFLSNDISAPFFYFRQLNMALLLVMSLLMTFMDNILATALLNIFMCGLLVYMYKNSKPFIESDMWKNNVKVFSLVVVMLAALLNALVYGRDNQGYEELDYITTVLAPSIVLLAFLLFGVLFFSFWYHVFVHDLETSMKFSGAKKMWQNMRLRQSSRRLNLGVFNGVHEDKISHKDNAFDNGNGTLNPLRMNGNKNQKETLSRSGNIVTTNLLAVPSSSSNPIKSGTRNNPQKLTSSSVNRRRRQNPQPRSQPRSRSRLRNPQATHMKRIELKKRAKQFSSRHLLGVGSNNDSNNNVDTNLSSFGSHTSMIKPLSSTSTLPFSLQQYSNQQHGFSSTSSRKRSKSISRRKTLQNKNKNKKDELKSSNESFNEDRFVFSVDDW
eukprot:TRINITY_DN570_c0_g1_i7.p1 TRINITY_DN570_c0_g1~~TRINITY_DN570_c0_g1_i7.p1  ORF type:complete len:4117 (-),score=1078.51 TRINITY_DN570_c0_g1_i7:252-11657(-)